MFDSQWNEKKASFIRHHFKFFAFFKLVKLFDLRLQYTGKNPHFFCLFLFSTANILVFNFRDWSSILSEKKKEKAVLIFALTKFLIMLEMTGYILTVCLNQIFLHFKTFSGMLFDSHGKNVLLDNALWFFLDKKTSVSKISSFKSRFGETKNFSAKALSDCQ